MAVFTHRVGRRSATLPPTVCFALGRRSASLVSVAVSKLGCSELIFVEPRVKVDGAYYRDVLLSHQMLPAIRHLAGDVFVFHQDSAPAHRARATVEYLRQATPEFISRDLWPPNSPDLNPIRLQDMNACIRSPNVTWIS